MSDMPERISIFRRDAAGVSFTAYRAEDVIGGEGCANEYIRAEIAASQESKLRAELAEVRQAIKEALTREATLTREFAAYRDQAAAREAELLDLATKERGALAAEVERLRARLDSTQRRLDECNQCPSDSSLGGALQISKLSTEVARFRQGCKSYRAALDVALSAAISRNLYRTTQVLERALATHPEQESGDE